MAPAIETANSPKLLCRFKLSQFICRFKHSKLPIIFSSKLLLNSAFLISLCTNPKPFSPFSSSAFSIWKMESDDDFGLSSPPEEPSPSITGRRLKRLKRANDVVSTDNTPPEPVIDLVDQDSSGSLMCESKILQSLRLEQLEESRGLLQQADPGFVSSEGSQGESGYESEDSKPANSEVRRSLVFNSTEEAVDEELGLGRQDESMVGHEREEVGEKTSGDSELIPSDEEGETEWKKKKKRTKRSKSATDDNEIMKAPTTNKRRDEKERREHLKQLHADSQRVLRETRDASFKPIPVVQKSISSVLEKIRQRKWEISKKNVTMKNNTSLFSRYIDVSDDDNNVDLEPLDLNAQKGMGENIAKAVEDDTVSGSIEAKSVFDTGSTEETNDMEDEPSSAYDTAQKTPCEEHAFRAPIDDTQELFSDSQTSGSIDESPTDSPGSPMEENFAPSLLAMNLKLKLDSAPVISDDEEEDETNDKENVDPNLHKAVDVSLPLKDPARNFLDVEAEEEDDSDNDPFHSQENEDEDEDAEDAQELNDMIATNFVENPIDGEMRNELHQKWLEQQDTFGMKKLLQKIKGGSKDRETAMLEDEDDHVGEENDTDDDEDNSDEDNADTLAPKSVAQLNLRRIKQMMLKVFADEDDPYISSEDEEYERTLAKQSLFKKAEEKSTFLSPEEDEKSREVFQRIKKSSNMPETKKRAKTSALPDLLQTSVKSNCFQKPSFVGRGSNSSLASKNKKTSIVRSFIFSRGDSNSKSSISTPEELATVVEESRPVRPPTAKFSSFASQSKYSSNSQSSQVSSDTSNSTTSYILRRSSIRSTEHCVEETVDVRAESMFAAFRVEKRGRHGRI